MLEPWENIFCIMGTRPGCGCRRGERLPGASDSGSGFLPPVSGSPRWGSPTPTRYADFCFCSPQKSWPLIRREFEAEVVITDDSARPCSSFHLSSASAFSSLRHRCFVCILFVLYSASLFLWTSHRFFSFSCFENAVCVWEREGGREGKCM